MFKFVLGILSLSFVFGTVLDFTTSFLGILGVFGIEQLSSANANDLFLCLIAFVASLIVVSVSLFIPAVWMNAGFSGVSIAFSLLHMCTFAYDAFTSFFGTAQFVILNEVVMESSPAMSLSLVWDSATVEQQIAILFSTILVTASPIFLGLVYPVLAD